MGTSKRKKSASKAAAQSPLSNNMIGGAIAVVAIGAILYSGSSEEAPKVSAEEAPKVSAQTNKPSGAVHTMHTDYDKIAGDKWGNKCRNTHNDCQVWADSGECDKNPGFMITGCARSCNTCDELDPTVRCARNKFTSLPPAIEEGDLEKMFSRIADTDEFAELKPEVMSRDPWVIYFDQFVTETEIDAVWTAFNESGATFAPSLEKDTGEDGKPNQRRTSWSTQCNEPACYNDPRVLKLHERTQKVTNLPIPNQEFIQLVKYVKGQFYVKHHDTSMQYDRMPCGHRIYTLFVYFSDVEEGMGGETSFPQLDIKVRPKKGAAVLWANVMNDNPREVDYRTTHEARPVDDGVFKLAANMWLYQYDFRTPWKSGCTNF